MAEKYVRVVQDMNEDSMTAVRCAVRVSDGFQVELGLHQRSTVSHFFVDMVMDGLIGQSKSSLHGSKWKKTWTDGDMC